LSAKLPVVDLADAILSLSWSLMAFFSDRSRNLDSLSAETVLAWIDAVNAGDTERALELTTPDVAIVGPRGTGRGREVLRAWLGQAGATFVTRAIYTGSDTAVVDQRGIWRDPTSGAILGEADVATRFRVVAGQVAEIQRYESVAAALRDASLTHATRAPLAGEP
jgi:SnoaL-like protein